ncbi:MAG TPA: hypothetical protein VJS38_20135 [Phenylobacterium sp.]|uniref:hypothetical protein n=1 Tax=Phenylobacterium sp. TaxID=1871053 RepID=UPI002B480003|nr:hypothetical protein [Phenylobacterium sp.]HKR90486.1 hypothetical protein [Phenylobacterium sp.]
MLAVNRLALALVAAACLGLPAKAQQCAPGAVCSNGQIGGAAVGTLNGTLNVYLGQPREPRGLYQGAKQVGSFRTAQVDKEHGIVAFDHVAFTAYTDPAQAIEFGELKLRCKNAPVEGAGRFYAATMVEMHTFDTCEIVN